MTTPRLPGWYDDPHDASAQRYWDGQVWTPHRQRKPTARPTHPPPRQQPPPPRQPAPPRNPPVPPGRPPARAVPPQPPPSPPLRSRPQASPFPSDQIRGAGAEMVPDGLATVKGFAAKLSLAGWLVFGGLVVAAIATFFPFA